MFAFLFASALVHLLPRVYDGPPTFSLFSKEHVLTRQSILDTCRALYREPSHAPSFHERDVSDRFEEGTHPTLIRNATVFTGEYDDSGPVLLLHSDILLDQGIVKSIGSIDSSIALQMYGSKLETVEARGAWVTPGLSKSL